MIELFERCINVKDKYIHSEGEGGDYYIEVDGNVLYILFEGSDGAEDWRSNFDFLPSGDKSALQLLRALKNNICTATVPYKNTTERWRVHRGFLRVWKDMRDDVECGVEKLLKSNPQVSQIDIVGYSHGGAMAFLAYEDMRYIYGDRYTIRGFGFASPRVIFGRVPSDVKKRIEGFVVIRNGLDIVTHVPPRALGYKNSGEIIEIGRRHIYTPIGAHYHFAYIQALKEWEKKSRIDAGAKVWELDRTKAR